MSHRFSSPSQDQPGDTPQHACSRCGASCPATGPLCSRCDGAVSTIQAGGQHAASQPSGHQALIDEAEDLLEPGAIVGNYRIEAVLGVGGIGEVYLADHVKLGRKVALKKLREEFASNREVVSRFFDEARAANQIAHENIVEITDFIEDETDGAYLIMELLRGEDLGMVLEREIAIPVGRTLAVMRQVASALAAAHRAGIVHRDLKPDNVFITERGGQDDFVKVLDFGVAKLGDDVRSHSGHTTAAGTVLGTPAYMSPEQALGRNVDARTDIYAFGVILYELLTGELPFEGETLGEFVVAHAIETPRPPSEHPRLLQAIPPRLEDLIMRCLEKDPEARPGDMDEVEAELAGVAEGGHSLRSYAPPPPRPSLATEVPPAPRRGGVLAAAAVAAGLAIVVAGGAAWLLLAEPEAAPTPQAASETPPEPAPDPAPEVEVEPAPPPLPVGAEAPTTVTVSFRSEPSGAEVWREGGAARLGITPFEMQLPRADEAMVYELRLEDYETLRQEVALVADTETTGAMTAAPRASRRGARRQPTTDTPTRRAPREDPGRRGVLDF